MTSITFSFFGPPEQKHVCKLTAMQTLADALQSVSSKFKPPLHPDQCELHLNRKPLDMCTPFRLLNVPAGSKLEVIKKAPAAADVPAKATCAQADGAVAPLHPSVQPQAAAAAAAAPVPAGEEASVQQQPVAAAVPSTQEQPSTSAVAQQAAAAAAAQSSSAISPALAALGLTVPLYVFHHRAIEAAVAQEPSARDIDPPDEFFELTAADLQQLQQQANEKKKAESVFRTRAAREAEEAARAAALGPVPVRLHFPDGTILQAAFKATDPLSKVQDLMRKCAAPQLAAALYLYTTPPKTVLKDDAGSLYSLQLVPAAHVYVGLDEKKLQVKADVSRSGPFLRAEVQSLMQDTVPETHPAEQQRQQDAQAEAGSSSSGNDAGAVAAAQRAMRAAAAASRQAGAAGAAAAGAKVPKWFKK